jgi:penicillin amidase
LKSCTDIASDWPTAEETANLQRRFDTTSGPSYRLVVDMSRLDEATIVHTTGQSGLLFDSHYGDYIQRWLDNQPLPLPFTAAAVEAARTQLLTLTP